MSSLIHPLPVRLQVFPSKFNALSAKTFVFLPVICLKSSRISLIVRAHSAPTPPPPPPPETPQYITDILDGEDVKYIPCVRTYENDLGRLTIEGDVDLEQALTAVAADGGEAADEYIARGLEVMGLETTNSAYCDEFSTISTRLFLPSLLVKETSKDIHLTEDILSNTSSTDILGMKFRQETLKKLRKFEISMFKPGTTRTTRSMNDLAIQREVPPSFTFSSSSEQAISKLAEVISISALESDRKDFLYNLLGISSFNIFHLFHKHEQVSSQDSSVILFKVHEDEVVENAKSLLEMYTSMKESYVPKENAHKCDWWPMPIYTKLEENGGKEFSLWVREYVHAYRLQIKGDKLQDMEFEGWKESGENKWEALLTHSQMLYMANLLDIYYEDWFTFPDKKLNIKKKGNSLGKMLSTFIISGCLIVSVMGRIFLPHFQIGQKNFVLNQRSQSSHTESILLGSIDPDVLEDISIKIVKKMQECFGWSGEIRKESGGGVCTGKLPDNLRKWFQDISSKYVMLSRSTDIQNQEIFASRHSVYIFQIVVSSEGRIVGILNTRDLTVKNWASNPGFYGKKNVKPGFFEPSLMVKQPKEVVLLELVMLKNRVAHILY